MYSILKLILYHGPSLKVQSLVKVKFVKIVIQKHVSNKFDAFLRRNGSFTYCPKESTHEGKIKIFCKTVCKECTFT